MSRPPGKRRWKLARNRKTPEREETVHPNKRLGQHFLRDPSLVRKIVDLSRWKPSDCVIEVGPGLGALTLALSRRVRRVIAVEKDARLVTILAERLEREGVSNVTLVNEDILRYPLRGPGTEPFRRVHVAGNLPYNISSPFLERLLTAREDIGRAVVMLQAEFADRLSAVPGTKAYGGLTVWLRYHATCKRLLGIPASAFRPRPRVDSVLLEIDLERPHPTRAPDDDALRRVLKAAFSHRRKTVLNSLRASGLWPDPGAILKALAGCGIDPKIRAEQLGLEAFLCLSSARELTETPGRC